jgi:hypothetical protein
MRQRARDAWEPGVDCGLDDTGKQRWATKTVHGSRRYATWELARLAGETGYVQLRAGSVEQLLEEWFDVASPHWAAAAARSSWSRVGESTWANTTTAGRRMLLAGSTDIPVRSGGRRPRRS